MSPLGSEVITTSASATASAPLSNTWAPLSAAAAFSAGTGSKPRTVWPAATRLAAIGPPMWPNPKNAIVRHLGPFLAMRTRGPGRLRPVR